MTVIHILLIIGLVYIASQQNKSSTRNLILFVTGLLVISMASKEGFQLTFDRPNPGDPYSMDGWPVSDDVSQDSDGSHQIIDDDTNTKFLFHFQATGGQPILVDGSTSVTDGEAINCEVNDVPGVVGYNASQTNFSAAYLATATGPKITDYLTCTTALSNVDNLLEDLSDGQIDDQSNLARAQTGSQTTTQALTPAQLAALTPAQLAALTPTQTTTPTLTPDQLAALTPDQLAALTPAQLAALTPAQLAALTPAQLAALTPAQLATPTPDQLAAPTPTELAAQEAADTAAQGREDEAQAAIRDNLMVQERDAGIIIGRAQREGELQAMEAAEANCGLGNAFDKTYHPDPEEGLFRPEGQNCCDHTAPDDGLLLFSNRCT